MKWFLWLILGFILGAAWRIDLSGCNGKPSQEEELYELLKAAEDSLFTYRNKRNEQTAIINAYAASNANLLNDLKDKSKKIAEFNEVVKKFKNPAAVIEHKTELVYNGKGDIKIQIQEGKIKYPIVAQKDDEHFYGRVEINEKDSDWNILFRNSFEYGIETKRKGFLGYNGKEFIVKAHTNNPYVSTTDLNAFILHQKPQRLHIGVYGGMGIDLKPNIGVGIMYSLFQL